MSTRIYTELPKENISHLFNEKLILLVTATDLESDLLHDALVPLAGYDKIVKVYEGASTYYFGVLGKYIVAHVQCAMGSLARSSSITTVSAALGLLGSKVVVMVGIAFGVDKTSQRIGDVLLAESIIPYNSKRVGQKNTISRGIEAPSSRVLLNRFKGLKATWEHFLDEGLLAKLIPTRILSGEELVDNEKHRNKLIKENPDAKGGEMEGAGLYAACDGTADWILIKGICDFADGQKGLNKGTNQVVAMQSALSATLEIFNSEVAFQHYHIDGQNDPDEVNTHTDINTDVLFDLYDDVKEPFYIARDADNRFLQTLSQYGIWVFGGTGAGKSNLIIRNLIYKKVSFVQVNLAYCIDQQVDEYFKELLYELASKTDGLMALSDPSSFKDTVRIFIDILLKNYKDKELIIFIEEIPISEPEGYREFTTKFFSLLISKSYASGLERVKFVLSSLYDPTIHMETFQQKVHQQLSFIDLKYWTEEETKKLIEIIELEIGYLLPAELRNSLVLKSKGSPRFIKKFYRSLLAVGLPVSEATAKKILLDTERELKF